MTEHTTNSSHVNQNKFITGERIEIKLSKGNDYQLMGDDLVSFTRVTNKVLKPVSVDIKPFLLPNGTLEAIDEADREDAFYSFCTAPTKLLHRLINFTGFDFTDEETMCFNSIAINEASTALVNEILTLLVPSIIARINVLNEWSPRKTGELHITEIGDAIELSKPWFLPFAHPCSIIDMDYYPSHSAKIREDGMVTYVSVTAPDGVEAFTANDYEEILPDGSVNYPYVHGIPAFSEGTTWFCVKP